MKRLLSKTHPIVFFDIAIDGAQKGRVALEVGESLANKFTFFGHRWNLT